MKKNKVLGTPLFKNKKISGKKTSLRKGRKPIMNRREFSKLKNKKLTKRNKLKLLRKLVKRKCIEAINQKLSMLRKKL